MGPIPAGILLVERDALKPRFKRIKIQDHLNPTVWQTPTKMRPNLRQQLLTIANDFLTGDDTPKITVKDIVFTGSLANYNWSQQSDLDMHLLADFGDGQVGNLTHQLYDMLAYTWNEHHDIKLQGFEVEIYVADASAGFPHEAGVYSLQNDKWLIEPKPMAEQSIDWESVFKKANRIAEQVGRLETLVKQGHYEAAEHAAGHLKDRLKRQRTAGLERGGELSVENLVFKVLRRHGEIDRLRDLKTRAGDKALSH